MISVFDLLSIGVGPSSSHTVGPMKAANKFVRQLSDQNYQQTATVTIELFGSLAHTGKGHGTDHAILIGLEGWLPEQVESQQMRKDIERINSQQQLKLKDDKLIPFAPDHDIIFNLNELLPLHSNGMRFTAYDNSHQILAQHVYYSIGGGFIISDKEEPLAKHHSHSPPYQFDDFNTLKRICLENDLSIAEVVMENEKIWRNEQQICQALINIYQVMHQCIESGLTSDEPQLPGGLRTRRRAPTIARKLGKRYVTSSYLDWVNTFAIAVNEENAAGNRIVTAPTNGAAGVIPAVLEYYMQFFPEAKQQDIVEFLLTAGAIAALYKKGASISAAEVGCQGEIGVACSMAAGAFTAIRGGTLIQIENAAEMAMEHHLGLTCDPVAGLVQIPCIERNAVAATSAINLARMALLEEEENAVTLDQVIATMKQTGEDMSSKYKETSTGGLAINVPAC